MAENIPDGTQSPAEGAPQGHRTIKLTPLNVKPAPEAGAAPDQLPDRVELFSPVEMVQFRHQCAIKSVDAVLNILGHDRFSCFSGRSPSF